MKRVKLKGAAILLPLLTLLVLLRGPFIMQVHAANKIASETIDKLTWTLYDDGLMDFQGSGYIDYRKSNYYNYKLSVTRINIGEGVNLNYLAFKGFSNLKTVILPKTATYIAPDAFSECKSLESINLPEGMTSIGYGAFCLCTNLKNVVLPSTLKSIGNYAFAHCESITSIKIPDSLTSLGDSVFDDCKCLKDVQVKESLLEGKPAKFFYGTPWNLYRTAPHKGKMGNVDYVIDKAGNLTFSGTGDFKYNFPYNSEETLKKHAYAITSITFADGFDNISMDHIWLSSTYSSDGDFRNLEKITNNSSAKIILSQIDGDADYSWCYENNFTERVLVLNKGTVVRVNGKLPAYYTIAFDGDGATEGSMKNISGVLDDFTKLPKVAFKKKGYKADGYKIKGSIYYCSINADKGLYVSSEKIENEDIDTVTLIVNWVKYDSKNSDDKGKNEGAKNDGKKEDEGKNSGSGKSGKSDTKNDNKKDDKNKKKTAKKLKVGDAIKDKKGKKTGYVVTSVKKNKLTAKYVGCASDKKKKNLEIRKSIKDVNGNAYKVTAIGDKAFKGYKKLKKLTLPSTVTSIGKNAFDGCKSLKNVIMTSDKTKKAGKKAFKKLSKKAVLTVKSEKVLYKSALLKSEEDE